MIDAKRMSEIVMEAHHHNLLDERGQARRLHPNNQRWGYKAIETELRRRGFTEICPECSEEGYRVALYHGKDGMKCPRCQAKEREVESGKDD